MTNFQSAHKPKLQMDIEQRFPGITEAQELIDREGEPKLQILHWAEHKDGSGRAGAYFSYSQELAMAYARGKLACGHIVWINGELIGDMEID